MNCMLSIGVLFLAMASQACPNLTGEYFFKEHPWNGKIIVKQNGCESISLTEQRKVDPSPSNPNGDWEFTMNYLPNGVPYVGHDQANQKAQPTDHHFHVSQFLDAGLSIVLFEGSQEQCGLNHTFGDITGKCKKYEFRLVYLANLKSYVWEQIGFSWSENGWSDDILPLQKIR